MKLHVVIAADSTSCNNSILHTSYMVYGVCESVHTRLKSEHFKGDQKTFTLLYY